MKKLILVAFGILTGLTGLRAQTQLYFQDFNTGAASEWSLNTTIGNLTSTGNGDNYWLINNVYAGNSTWGVAATPSQPAGITGNPNSYYMHVTNGANNGIFADYNANFEAPETGNEVAAMNTPIVATGYTAVTLTFWYLCEGGNAHYTGQLYYSTNGGTTWTQEGGTYGSVSSWTQATITDPTWSNQASLEFAFVWVQTGNGSATATDPPWAVDDIKVVGTASVTGPPVASFTSSDSVGCQGSCFTFTDNSTNSPTSRVWTFTGGNPPSSTVSPVTVCYANAGTFPVKLVVTNSSGSDSITKASAITINAKPNAGVDQDVTCFPSNTSATMAGTGTGTWTAETGNPGTATITTPTSPTTTITAISAVGTYHFIWTSNGCTDTAAVIVTAKPNAGPDQTVSCVTLPGGSATMAGTGTGTWTAQAGNPGTATIVSATSPTTNITTFSAAGTYHFIWTNGGCTDTAAVVVTAKPNAGADQFVTCFPSNTSATMAGTGTGTWTAETGNPGTATITTPSSPTTTITAISAVGTYNFIWTSSGCTDTAAVIVTAKPNAGPDQTVSCVTLPGGSATMAGTGTGTWTAQAGNPGTATIVSSTSPTTSITTFSAAGTYHFIWTNGGCTDTAAIVVTAKPNAGSDQTICQYTNTALAATGTGTWTQSGSNPATATITNASSPTTSISGFTAAGTYAFYWSNGGCSDTVNITVTAKPNAGSDQNLCQYGNTTLAATGSGTWSASGSNPAAVTFVSNTSPTTFVSGFTSSGTYTLFWSANGCSDTMKITVAAKPNAGSDQSFCSSTSSTVMAASGTGTWSAAASNPTVVTITNTTSPTTSISGFNVAGVYSFYWSNGGCSDTVEINVTAKPNAGADQNICQYESTTMAGTGTGTWTVAASNPAVVSFTNTGSPTAIASGFNAPGTYVLYWSLNGCSDTVNIDVTAKPNAGTDQNICQFSTATMTATGTGTWTTNGSNPAFSNIVSVTSPTTAITGFTQPGAYTFYWSLSGCTDTVVVNVTTIPSASIVATTDSLTAMPAGASYQWLKSGVAISGATSQVYYPTQSGSYEVIVTEGGCSDTSTAVSFVYKPNGVSNISEVNVTIWPNPFNDHIEIGLGDMSSASIEIYSILGTRVLSGSYQNHASIDMTTISSGVYIIHVRNDKVDITRMITKQ